MMSDKSFKKRLKSEIIKKDLYVFDVLTGANTITEALELRNDLIP